MATGTQSHTLARHMGLTALVIYGVGDMLGAGVYALVGTAAGQMGNAVWLAFAVSMVAALLTGLSYACIGSRYPRAAGAAYVTQRAFNLTALSYIVGLAVACSGLTSMASGANAIAGFITKLAIGDATSTEYPNIGLYHKLIALGFLIFVMLVVYRGIRESTWMNFICTGVEVLGLMIVVAVGIRFWGGVNYLELPPPSPGTTRTGWLSALLVLQTAQLTFFSFLGFEDILNVAEEVKEPRRTIPLGLILALIIATIVYMAVSITAVSVVHYSKLAQSKNALVDVVQAAAPWFPSIVFSGISIFAVANTALLNYVMGSRLLYGMSRQGMLPAILGRVHPKRRTPHVAIFILLGVVALLALLGNITQLAAATTLLLLSVFVVVNVGLILLKRRRDEPRGSFEVPSAVPFAGAIVCLTLVIARIVAAVQANAVKQPQDKPLMPLWIAGGILVVIVVMYLILRPKNVIDDAPPEPHD